jgi:alkylation response protein AidB-like acyl-CoA dehydrogenase
MSATTEDTLTENAFTEEALEFLRANAKPKIEEKRVWGEGSDKVGLLTEKTKAEEELEVAEAKSWRQRKFDAGFGWISGPAEFGGRALGSKFERIYQGLESGFAVPDQSSFGISLGMVAPTILAHATPEVKDAYLTNLWRGSMIACQLFSEPVAGSDLAGLQTKAELDGEEWVLNGQKVWTSGAQYSDIGEIICRTDPDAPKHKGLSGFIVNMRSPGVEVRPLRQMTGGASFNEVFFTDVRVPASHLLADVNQGWTVALTTLMNERASIGGGGAGGGVLGSNAMVDLLRHFGRDRDPIVRQRLADIFINSKVASYTSMRAMEKIKAGQLPGPEMSIGKLSLTNNLRRISDLVSLVLGPRILADTGEWGTYAFAELVLGVPGMRVAGGTDEIMRNIVGERVLGLPKEPGLSK